MNDTVKELKEENLKPSILYPILLSLRFEGQMRPFSNELELNTVSASKPALRGNLNSHL